ncbi:MULTISPECIES: amino acid ABC transporter permease [unclassified Sporolactobacillus]|uniref:amino acid ABC transporter permease n=1 Tax=unclassified Sporolactobacillus TaxID=2628533 RepID=UPI0023685350|nr:amino acid ABC transporter permease [Sporolactobacillus sp. CQH2019]MDD9148416.1 amino acid ABC transporter permease [Sporolactobacillus sp. CQH2019]
MSFFVLGQITIDWQLAAQSFWPILEGGLVYTIPLAVVSFIFGLVIALIMAVLRLSHVRLLQTIARVYISIIRGTPLLVQLSIIYFGLPDLGIEVSPFLGAIAALSLNVGGYAAETIRASILSVPKGQWEAGYTIGMNYFQTLRRIILPQAARVSVPPLSNTFISLVKDTSLASTVTVTELFRKAQEITATSYDFLLLYSEAALIYWIFCFFLSLLQGWVEARLDRYTASN